MNTVFKYIDGMKMRESEIVLYLCGRSYYCLQFTCQFWERQSASPAESSEVAKKTVTAENMRNWRWSMELLSPAQA